MRKKTAYRSTTRYTTRTKVTQTQIEKLRTTRLNNATTWQERKFFSSKSFDRLVRKQARDNTRTASLKLLQEAKNLFSQDPKVQRGLDYVLGEGRAKYIPSRDKWTTVQGFHTQAKLKQLQIAVRQLKNNEFNLKRRVVNRMEFMEIKQYLPEGKDNVGVAIAVQRGGFYFENTDLILKYNKIAARRGQNAADSTKTGFKLYNQYVRYKADNNPVLQAFIRKDL